MTQAIAENTAPIWLFTAQTTDANSAAHIFSYPGQKATVTAFGTWGGATLALQTLASDNSTWIPVPDSALNPFTFTTSNSQATIGDVVLNQQIRGVLSNAGMTTSLNLTLQGI